MPSFAKASEGYLELPYSIYRSRIPEILFTTRLQEIETVKKLPPKEAVRASYATIILGKKMKV